MIWADVANHDRFELTAPVQFFSEIRRESEGNGYFCLPEGFPVVKHATAKTRAYIKRYMEREVKHGREPDELVPLKLGSESPWFPKGHVFYLKVGRLKPVDD